MKRVAPPTPAKSQPMPKKAKTTKTKKVAKRDYKKFNAFEFYRPKGPRTVIPPKQTTVLKYSEVYVGINPAVGSAAAYVFACIDARDPNVTGVGHQPTGFDQWMALYNRFTVLQSKIKATFYTVDTETLDTVVGIAIFDGSTTTTTTEKYMEQPNTSWAVLPAGAGADTVTCYANFDLKTFSSSKVLYDNDLFQGSSTVSPGRNWYYHLFAGATGAAEDPATVKASVEIEYLISFYEPKTLDIS